MNAPREVRTPGAWASPLNRWHDEETLIVHFAPNGPGPVLPACGARIYSLGGTRRETRIPANACRRCAAIAARWAGRSWEVFAYDPKKGENVYVLDLRALGGAGQRWQWQEPGLPEPKWRPLSAEQTRGKAPWKIAVGLVARVASRCFPSRDPVHLTLIEDDGMALHVDGAGTPVATDELGRRLAFP